MSMRKAVNDKCKECIYDPKAGGTWKSQTESCPSTTCPIHPYRPVTAETARIRAKEKKAIKNGGNNIE